MLKWFSKPDIRAWQEKKYLVIDLELTGLDPEEDAIISAGSVHIIEGRINLNSAEHHYFQPTSLMGSDVSDSAHIHMITDQQLEIKGERLQDWLVTLSTDLAADAWVFHHAQLDVTFLQNFSRRLKIPLPDITVIDTLQLEKNNRSEDFLESHAQLNLNVCRARYGLPVYRQHHALSDALATAELFIAQKQLGY